MAGRSAHRTVPVDRRSVVASVGSWPRVQQTVCWQHRRMATRIGAQIWRVRQALPQTCNNLRCASHCITSYLQSCLELPIDLRVCQCRMQLLQLCFQFAFHDANLRQRHVAGTRHILQLLRQFDQRWIVALNVLGQVMQQCLAAVDGFHRCQRA
jgi:hypothetical protein